MAVLTDSVVLFGDSLTQRSWDDNGIAARFASIYGRRFDVLNRGYSGYNTEWAIPIFRKIFPLDLNCKVPSANLMVISMLENLRTMIHEAPASACTILITPPPVNPKQWAIDLALRDPPQEQDRDFESARQYAEAVKELGTNENIPVVDVWAALWNAAGQNEQALSAYLSDGLHLNAEGYKVAFDAIAKTIEESIPEFRLEHSWRNYEYPTWEWYRDHGFDGWEERREE